MAKSKRATKVHVTKVVKATKERKAKLAENIRQHVKDKRYLHIIELENDRNVHLKALRELLKPDGRILLGKLKLMTKIIGRTAPDEMEDGFHKISPLLNGHRALLASNKPAEEIQSLLQSYQPIDFAKPGFMCTETVTLEPANNPLEDLSFSLETRLRQLGLPTKLENGKIVLLGKHTVCEAGKPLSTEGSHILKYLDIKMSKFEVRLIATFDRNTHEIADANMLDEIMS